MDCIIIKYDGNIVYKDDDSIHSFEDCFKDYFLSIESFTKAFTMYNEPFIAFFDDVFSGYDDDFEKKYNEIASKLVQETLYGDVIVCSPIDGVYDLYDKNSYKNMNSKFVDFIMSISGSNK